MNVSPSTDYTSSLIHSVVSHLLDAPPLGVGLDWTGHPYRSLEQAPRVDLTPGRTDGQTTDRLMRREGGKGGLND